MKKEISLPNSNLYLTGFGLDINGNRIVKLKFPIGRGFSIQTNGILRGTQSISDRLPKNGIKGLTIGELTNIEIECVSYITYFGSKLQKSKLLIFGAK